MSVFSSFFNDDTDRTTFSATVYRIVNADKLATANISDSPFEQSRLDALLRDTAAPCKSSAKHHLFTSAFKKPPLKYGSRFGSVNRDSYFYASKSPTTCLAECAYYRFLFLKSFDEPFNGRLEGHHLLFSCSLSCDDTLDLNNPVFSKIRSIIISSSDYSFTQQIGQWAANNNYQSICFPSARHDTGINCATSTINCIKSKNPRELSYVKSLTDSSRVAFEHNSKTYHVSSDVMVRPITL